MKTFYRLAARILGLGSEIAAIFAGLDVPEFEPLPAWTLETIDFSGPEYGPPAH